MTFNKWANNCIGSPWQMSQKLRKIYGCVLLSTLNSWNVSRAVSRFSSETKSQVQKLFVHYHPGWFPVYRGNFIFVINIKLFRTIKCVTFFLLGIKSEQNFNCNIYFVLMSIFRSWTYVVIVLVEWMLLNCMYLLNNTKLLFSNLQNNIVTIVAFFKFTKSRIFNANTFLALCQRFNIQVCKYYGEFFFVTCNN